MQNVKIQMKNEVIMTNLKLKNRVVHSKLCFSLAFILLSPEYKFVIEVMNRRTYAFPVKCISYFHGEL